VRQIEGAGRDGGAMPILVIAASLGLIVYAVAETQNPAHLAVLGAVIAVATVTYKALLAWRSLLMTLLGVILFIPIRRYSVPGNLPFQLEPYRLVVLFIAAGWLTSLLVDPRVRARLSGLEGPIFLIVTAVIASDVANSSRIHTLGVTTQVIKKITFLISFLLVFYVLVSLLRKFGDIVALIRVLAGGGAVLAAFALIEARTGFNPFNHLNHVLPFLTLTDSSLSADQVARGGQLRVYGSAQHPIAFGAFLVVLIPLALYLARTRGQRRWWLATGLLTMAAFATVSRTTIVMIVVGAAVIAILRPADAKQVRRFILPVLVVIHIALPGTLGSIKEAFLPQGGIVAQQTNTNVGSGRVASFGPAVAEISRQPLFGVGFGTRIVDITDQNAYVLDDEWLSTALETGLLGLFAWGWLFVRYIRRLGRAARADTSDRGWLLTALTASIAAFAVGMAFYDAFSFIQVTIAAFILLAIGSAAMAATPPPLRETAS
jgi:O-antigen ligase